MKTTRIYTNGKSLFTLENYDKVSAVCHINGITFHSEVSQLKRRAMHENGMLKYIFGTGDRKLLSNVNLKKNTKIGNFTIL